MIYAITLLAVFLCGSNSAIPHRPEAKPNIQLSKFKKTMRDISDFLGIEILGYQAVSEENEEYIRVIQHELDMDDFCIEIRRLTNVAQLLVGRANAFVIASPWFSNKSHAYLYISEDWFNTLSDAGKQALIRHELMHLKHDHTRKKMLFYVSMTLGFNLTQKSLNKYISSNEVFPYPLTKENLIRVSTIFSSLKGITGMVCMATLSRMLEKEADIEAAKTMSNKHGFVDVFEDIKYNTEDPKSKFKIKRIISRVVEILASPLHILFDTHPELDDRIDYIKNMA